jgi:hypothetical protein
MRLVLCLSKCVALFLMVLAGLFACVLLGCGAHMEMTNGSGEGAGMLGVGLMLVMGVGTLVNTIMRSNA